MAGKTRAITLRVIDAFNRRDVAALQQLLAPDAELVPMRAAMEGTTFSGPAAAALFFDAIDETWEDLSVEPDEIRVSDGGVFATGRIRATGRESRVEVAMELAWILQFDGDALIKSLRTYVDIGEAEAAAAEMAV